MVIAVMKRQQSEEFRLRRDASGQMACIVTIHDSVCVA